MNDRGPRPVAYVDTSCLIAVSFDEPGASEMRERLVAADVLLSSNLLEAEYRATMAREGVPPDGRTLTWLRWVLPDRPLGPEMQRALDAGYLRGADLWHLSTALYVATVPAELSFLTLDARQREAARALGFAL